MYQLPDGIVTSALTEVEGRPSLGEDPPDEMTPALGALDRLDQTGLEEARTSRVARTWDETARIMMDGPG